MADEQIIARFGADTGPIDRAMRGLRTKMGSWGDSVSGSIKRAFSTLAAPLSIGAFIAGTKAVLNQVEQIKAKAADWGVSTDFVQDIQNIGVAAGLSSQAIDGMMDKFIKGLPVGASVQKEFMAIADRIAGIKDPVERAKVAMEAFGKSGMAMLRVVSGGSKEIEKLAESFSKLDRIDLKQIEEADNVLDKFTNRTKVYFARFVAALSFGARVWGRIMSGDARYRGPGGGARAASDQEVEDLQAVEAESALTSKMDAVTAKTKAKLAAEEAINKTYKERNDLYYKALSTEEKLKQLEKDRADNLRISRDLKRDEVDRAIAATNVAKIDLEIATAKSQIDTAKRNAQNARGEFTKWDLADLASQPNNLPTVRAAREAMRQFEFAKQAEAMQRPDWVKLHRGNYEKLVKDNPALREAIRNPFAEADAKLAEINSKLGDSEGIPVKSVGVVKKIALAK